MAGKHKHLYGHHQRLNSKNNRVDSPHRIYHVKELGLTKSKITRREQFVVTGVGIGNALTARHHV